MTDIIIKYFFIIMCCIFLYKHLLNLELTVIKHRIFLSMLTISLSIFSYWGKKYFPVITDITLLILLWFCLNLILCQPQLTLIITAISYCFSYGLFAFSNIVILALFTPTLYLSSAFPYELFMLLSGIVEYVLLTAILHIKRFRKGMPFLYSSAFLNGGTCICLLILTLIFYIQLSAHPSLYFAILVPIIFTFSIGALIYWWQQQLTASYLTRLKLLELESLRNELLEKSIQISKLTKQNEELSRLIHKDNKLIPAMENAVYHYISSSNSNGNSISYGNALLADLQNLTEKRQKILSSFSYTSCDNFSTGITSLDALLTYMNEQASLSDITFSVTIGQNLPLQISESISAEDLTHLLADLIENAFTATFHQENNQSKIVQLQIFSYHNALLIELSDTGIAFEVPTLMKLGIEPATTHASSGGKGIGLLDIWNIKNKYNASIHITEYETTAAFRKKITFILDHKNHYLIHSWRADELIAQQCRSDLKILELSS